MMDTTQRTSFLVRLEKLTTTLVAFEMLCKLEDTLTIEFISMCLVSYIKELEDLLKGLDQRGTQWKN